MNDTTRQRVENDFQLVAPALRQLADKMARKGFAAPVFVLLEKEAPLPFAALLIDAGRYGNSYAWYVSYHQLLLEQGVLEGAAAEALQVRLQQKPADTHATLMLVSAGKVHGISIPYPVATGEQQETSDDASCATDLPPAGEPVQT